MHELYIAHICDICKKKNSSQAKIPFSTSWRHVEMLVQSREDLEDGV